MASSQNGAKLSKRWSDDTHRQTHTHNSHEINTQNYLSVCVPCGKIPTDNNNNDDDVDGKKLIPENMEPIPHSISKRTHTNCNVLQPNSHCSGSREWNHRVKSAYIKQILKYVNILSFPVASLSLSSALITYRFASFFERCVRRWDSFDHLIMRFLLHS